MPKCQHLGQLMQMTASEYICHKYLCSQGGPQPPLPAHPPPPPTPQEDPPRPAGRSGPGSYEISTFAFGFGVHEILCAPFKSEICFLQSSLQSQMLWGPLFPVLDLQARGSLTWGSELSLLWENLCNIIIFQFLGHPPRENGI